jgi:cell division protein FtsQ
VIGLAGLATTWAARQVLASSWTNVRTINVHGNSYLSRGEVDALLVGLLDQKIFDVNLEDYRRHVMDSPWVADVTVRRVLPSTIDLRIVERTPLAIARLGQQLYLVDRTGVIIDEFGPQYRGFDLPLVDGLVAPPSDRTPLVDAGRVALLVSFLTALEARQDLRERVSQIDVHAPHDLVAMFDDDTAWLHLGESRFVERLVTYLELAPTLRDKFTAMDYVDLRFGDRVFVRSKGKTATVAKTGQEN